MAMLAVAQIPLDDKVEHKIEIMAVRRRWRQGNKIMCNGAQN